MGMLRPLAFLAAWAQQRIGVRNPAAARPAIALPKKVRLFMISVKVSHWVLLKGHTITAANFSASHFLAFRVHFV
jgi:hypothetical protein